MSACASTKTLKLRIESKPTGAQVSLDGMDLGSTPATSEVKCATHYGLPRFNSPEGSHILTIEAVDDDGQEQRKVFFADSTCNKPAGSTVKVFFNMKRKDAPKEQKIDLKIKNE